MAKMTEAKSRVDEIVALLADKSYLQPLADYLNKGHLSYYGQLCKRDGGLLDAILDRRTALTEAKAGEGRALSADGGRR